MVPSRGTAIGGGVGIGIGGPIGARCDCPADSRSDCDADYGQPAGLSEVAHVDALELVLVAMTTSYRTRGNQLGNQPRFIAVKYRSIASSTLPTTKK